MLGLAGQNWRRTAKRALPALALGLSIAGFTPQFAQAQFFGGWGGGWGNGGGGFWGGGGMGPGEVYQAISERGFRVIAPLRRNGAVFVADVVDPRGRRERLIVAAADGQILQRFLLDGPRSPDAFPYRRTRPAYDNGATADRGDPVPPASIPGVGSEPDAEPPTVVPVRPRVVVPRPPRHTQPRFVARTPEPKPQRDSAPLQLSPAPPRPKFAVPPHLPREEPGAATATRSGEPSPRLDTAPASRPARMSDPLRIPGGEPSPPAKSASEPPAKASAAAAPAATKPVTGTVTGAPAAPVAPPEPAPASKPVDVPAAPLD